MHHVSGPPMGGAAGHIESTPRRMSGQHAEQQAFGQRAGRIGQQRPDAPAVSLAQQGKADPPSRDTPLRVESDQQQCRPAWAQPGRPRKVGARGVGSRVGVVRPLARPRVRQSGCPCTQLQPFMGSRSARSSPGGQRLPPAWVGEAALKPPAAVVLTRSEPPRARCRAARPGASMAGAPTSRGPLAPPAHLRCHPETAE